MGRYLTLGILEEGFHRLHWPPLVRNCVITKEYPGYRYEFFQSFAELDEYFTRIVGPHWRREPWAEFWIGQHHESQHSDRKELRTGPAPKHRPTAQYMKSATALGLSYLREYPSTTVRKLMNILTAHDFPVSYYAAWRIIKRFKENDSLFNKDN